MKKKEEIFSIIIPVYNCEKYLEKCINSILNQTYKKFELILIDDGSTDNSAVICDNYSKKNKKIKVIHKKNTGVSDSRNIGIKLAIGKYVCFFDSDDYVEADFLEYALKMFDKYNMELLNTGFFSEVQIDEKSSYDLIKVGRKNYRSENEIKKDLVYLWDNHMLYNVWNKVYLLSIIKKNNIKFPNYNFGEDMEFNKCYLSNISKFYNSDRCFYHYIKERKDSITAKYNSNLFDIRVKEYYEFNKYFEENGFDEEEYIEFSSRRFIERVLGCVENICGSNLSVKQKKKEINKIINHNLTNKTLKISKLNSKKIKIMVIPIKLKCTWLLYKMGCYINKVRIMNPKLFNKLKNKR